MEWISADDRLPEENDALGYSKDVLMWHKHYGAIVGYRYKGTWEAENEFHQDENLDDVQDITHWAAITPPKD